MKAFGRIEQHPILGKLEKRKAITFRFDGQTYDAFDHETIAAALLANGIRTLRVQEEKGTPRGIYCNIGHCLECRVTVNGRDGVRACLTPVEEDMIVHSGQRLPISGWNEVQHR
jgi:sarcosine oxidase, subunit alpha